MGYGDMIAEIRDYEYDTTYPSGNTGSAEYGSQPSCNGELCPDGTCRVCHYSGAFVDY